MQRLQTNLQICQCPSPAPSVGQAQATEQSHLPTREKLHNAFHLTLCFDTASRKQEMGFKNNKRQNYRVIQSRDLERPNYMTTNID